MINTSECEECNFGTIIENSKADVRVYCAKKEKTYWFGQCIPCDDKRKRMVEADKE